MLWLAAKSFQSGTYIHVLMRKQIVNSKKPGHFYKLKKPAQMAIFCLKREHVQGKENIWQLYQ
jgi:hypothetical protein